MGNAQTVTGENIYTLLSIDAWRYDGCWQWNNWFRIEADIYLDPETTNRELLAFMRRNKWLSEASKGRVSIEDDGYNIVICDRNTGKPLYAFEPASRWLNDR